MFREYLSSKMEHITTSSLYSHILLWGDKLPLKSNNRKQQQQHRNGSYYYDDYRYYYGLQTLVHSEENKPVVKNLHRYNMGGGRRETYSLSQTSSLWSSSSLVLKSTVMGDLIGTESGDCMSCDVEMAKGESESENRRKIKSERRRSEREFPPSITLMTETGRMAWSFKRKCTEDGRRLIIMAERVRRQEYVEADRENGRLTMKLVHDDDDDDYCEECGWPIDDEVEEIEKDNDFEEDSEELSLSNESSRRRGSLRHYAGGGSSDQGLFRDSDNNSLWIGNANNITYLGRPGTAPLQPMTPVM